MAAVVLPWVVLIIATLAGRSTDRIERFSATKVGWVLLGGSLTVFFVLGCLPSLASGLGLAATATLGIGSLTGMVAAVGLLMQENEPAEIFRFLGLERSPYVTVLVVTLVVVGLFSGTGTIHRVDRGGPAGSLPLRPDLSKAFTDWLGDDQACRVTVGGRQVRPMLLIAAEGGGIRAAYWTVSGLQKLSEENPCAGRSVLSTGASGGSVGLTVARFSGTADEETDQGITRAVEAVDQMAEEGILASGADGMFIRNTFYGATGVPLPRLDRPRADRWRWADRGRLLEQDWQDAYEPGVSAGAPDRSSATRTSRR